MKTFAEMLTHRIAELGVTNAEVARWMSVTQMIPTSREAVRLWASGATCPEPWKWQALLDALGIAINQREPWRAAMERFRAPAEPAAKVS